MKMANLFSIKVYSSLKVVSAVISANAISMFVGSGGLSNISVQLQATPMSTNGQL